MPEKNTAGRLEELLAPIVEGLGYELYDLEFVKEGPNWYLRLFIDKDPGVTIDDCELVSRGAEKALDENDPIPQAYILEVSSPGVDRQLKKAKHFERYAGRRVDIRLFKPLNSKKEYRGELMGLENGTVRVKTESNEIIAIEKANLALCRLSFIQLLASRTEETEK